MLQTLFPDANTDHRNAFCDSCGGCIGGPRLFCLDCAIKNKNLFNTLDLCSEPQCVGARITHREDLKDGHEPNHRLIKVRTSVLSRSHGRVHTAASNAFERVEETCRKVAELTSHPEEETGPDEQKVSNMEPSSTETPAKSDKPDDALNPPEGTKGGAEVEGDTAVEGTQDQVPDEGLPTCGNCKKRLSFPFWYCMFCEG